VPRYWQELQSPIQATDGFAAQTVSPPPLASAAATASPVLAAAAELEAASLPEEAVGPEVGMDMASLVEELPAGRAQRRRASAPTDSLAVELPPAGPPPAQASVPADHRSTARAEPTKLAAFGRVAIASFGLCVMVTLIITLGGYLTFGDRTDGLLLNNFAGEHARMIVGPGSGVWESAGPGRGDRGLCGSDPKHPSTQACTRA
jgi:hypothetical protein